jgi:uncharacterized Zn finger protein
MNGLLCPKCKSSATVDNGWVPRKGGKKHTSRCNDCGYIGTDDKFAKTMPEHTLISEPPKPKKPIAETPKSRRLIDKGHIL